MAAVSPTTKKAPASWTQWMHPRKPTGTEVPEFWRGVFKLNYLHLSVLLVPPMLALYGLLTRPLYPSLFFLAGVFWFWHGLGITAGYHRLWSHCAFTASMPCKLLLAFLGAGAFEGSILWWCRNHRAHHRYVDTDKDPYNALRGFTYTHVGWMVMAQNHDAIGRVNITDLRSCPVVGFQHRHYLALAVVSGLLLPAVCGWLVCGDFLGGLLISGALKVVVVHHSTFMINSVAHFRLPAFVAAVLGVEQTYSDGHSTFDNPAAAVLTHGEGYHNFHHEFPQDYRNGVRAWQYDPTKWFIRVLAALGWAHALVRFPGSEIEKERLRHSFKLHLLRAGGTLTRLNAMGHGPRDEALPAMSMAAVVAACRPAPHGAGRRLMVLDGFVYDVDVAVECGKGATHESSSTAWLKAHPGGEAVLLAYVGKDATRAFAGDVYRHSDAARNLLSQLKVARLESVETDESDDDAAAAAAAAAPPVACATAGTDPVDIGASAN